MAPEYTTTVPVRVTRDQLLSLDHISKREDRTLQEVAESVMSLGLEAFAKEESHYEI